MTDQAPSPSSPPPDKRRFSSWLKVMAEYAGVTEPSRLHTFLLDHGCQCTQDSAADWLAGGDPSFEKSRDIIKAFHLAFPDIEVWEQYKRFVRGEPYMQLEPESTKARETLEDILQRSGLPPGLTD